MGAHANFVAHALDLIDILADDPSYDDWSETAAAAEVAASRGLFELEARLLKACDAAEVALDFPDDLDDEEGVGAN